MKTLKDFEESGEYLELYFTCITEIDQELFNYAIYGNCVTIDGNDFYQWYENDEWNGVAIYKTFMYDSTNNKYYYIGELPKIKLDIVNTRCCCCNCKCK